MKIAYLILAHNNPKHLAKLIESLETENSDFFIHIDKKSNINDFLSIARKGVQFVEAREKVYWGGFSQVQAIINLTKAANQASTKYDYFVLLSGADFPIQSRRYIERYLESKNGTQFINIVQMPCEKAGKPLSRFQQYNPEGSHLRLRKFIHKCLVKSRILPKKDFKKSFSHLEPYGGSTWWALTADACDYMLQFIERNPAFVKFFRDTASPDESFFQTILGNSPFKDKFQHNLTYTDWSEGKANPANMTLAHISKLKASPKYMLESQFYGQGECLFARKFVGDTTDLVATMAGHFYKSDVDGDLNDRREK